MSRKRYCLGALAINVVWLFFWIDYLVLSLSDFPALFLCGVFAYCLLMLEEPGGSDARGKVRTALIAFSAGLCAYGAYNVRAVYGYGIIATIAIFIWRNRRKDYKLLVAIALIMGVALAAIPQVEVNRINDNTYLPLVPTWNYSSADLKNVQLSMGLRLDRYETYVGTDPTQKPNMCFEDSAGIELSQREGLTGGVSLGELALLTAKYPLDIVSIYGKHLVNYLTVLWNHCYIYDIRVNTFGIVVANMLLWIVSILAVVSATGGQASAWLKERCWIQQPFILVCLFMIPGAPEVRFFISLYTLMYGFLAYGLDVDWFRGCVRAHPARYLIAALVLLCVWATVVGGTLASNGDGVVLFNNLP